MDTSRAMPPTTSERCCRRPHTPALDIPAQPLVAASCRILLALRLLFALAALIQFFAKLRRQISSLNITAELPRADVRDDGPSVARGNLRGVAIHRAEAVRNDVVDITVRHVS